MRQRIVERGRLGAVVDHQHAARHGLNAADADGGQGRVADPGNEPVGGDARGRGARQRAVVRRRVVDGQHGQAVALLDGTQLRLQPCAVLGRDVLVALGACVPAAVQRLGCHHLDLVAYARHDVKAPVQDEPDAGKALVQGLDHAHQAVLLGLFVELRRQAVGIHGVEKEAPVAALPQRCHHPAGKEVGPVGHALVDHVGLPVLVARELPGLRNLGVVRARRQHFGHRDVGVKARGRELRTGVAGGVGGVVRFDDHDVERAEVRQRQRITVVQRDGRRGRMQGSGQQPAGQQAQEASPQAQSEVPRHGERRHCDRFSGGQKRSWRREFGRFY